MTLAERVEAIVRAWPEWSRAERRRMEDIVAEVIDHCANGTGNRFIRDWCDRFLWLDSGEGPFETEEQARDFGTTEVGVPWRVRQGTRGWFVEVMV